MSVKPVTKGSVGVSRIVGGYSTTEDAIDAAQRWYRNMGWEPVDAWSAELLSTRSHSVIGWAIPPTREVSNGDEDL